MKIFPQKTVLSEKSSILLKEKKTTGAHKNDCLNCLFSPGFKFGFLLNPIVGKCKHLNQNHSGKAVYEANNTLRILSLIFLISSFIGNLVYLQKFGSEAENYVLFIAGSYNIIKTEVVLFIVIILLLKLPTRVKYIYSLSYFFENKKFYGINNLICGPCAKLIRNRIYFMIYGSLLMLVVYPLIYYIQYGRDAFKYTNLIFFFTASVQSSLLYNACSEFDVLRLLYRSVHISLTNHLEGRRNNIYSVNGTLTLEEKLRRISHLYLELKKCVDNILDYVGFVYIFSTMSMLFLIILNIYSVFLILTSDGCCIWLVQINIWGQLWFLLNLIRFADGASEQSGETLKYLFNYPISRLKDREAFQVELIIKTLVVRNPRIDIRHMLTLDTGFMASVRYMLQQVATSEIWLYLMFFQIAGIVVTFSMVVIQLHMVLDKNDLNVLNNTDMSDFFLDYVE